MQKRILPNHLRDSAAEVRCGDPRCVEAIRKPFVRRPTPRMAAGRSERGRVPSRKEEKSPFCNVADDEGARR